LLLNNFGFAACCEDGLGPSVSRRKLCRALPFDSEFSLDINEFEGLAQDHLAQLTEGQSPSSQQAAKPEHRDSPTFEAMAD
jgi:hypothetical protein